MADHACFSDPILLAHLDGELSAPKSRSVTIHISTCKSCQARQNELKSLAQTYADAMATDEILPPHRVETARQKFLEQIRSNPNSRSFSRRSKKRRLTFPLAAGLVACAALTVIAFRHPHSTQDSRKLLVLAREYERETLAIQREPVHQAFAIRIKQSRPIQKEQASTLDIFSDATHSRASLKWRDDKGHLRYAVWHPGDGAAYEYNSGSKHPSVIEMPAQNLKDTSRIYIEDVTSSDTSVEAMELGVQEWIRQTNWEPLLLAKAFAVFCEENNIVPRSAIYRNESGNARIALSAEKQLGGHSIRIELLLDKTSHRPLMERVICADKINTVELIASAKHWEVLRSDSPKTSMCFYPDSALPNRRLPLTATNLSRPSSRSSGQRSLVDKRILDDLHVQTLYALHQIGACLGDPISVERNAHSIVVSGLLDSAERRSEITKVLAGLSKTGYLRIQLKTVTEVLADKGAPSEQIQAAVPTSQVTVRMKTAALDSILMQILDTSGSSTAAASKRIEFANEALSRSAALLAHAWAFRHLSESFFQASPADLTSKVLIEKMARDHLNEIAKISAALEQQFTPVFIAEDIMDPKSQPYVPKNETSLGGLPVFVEATHADQYLHLLLSDPRQLQKDRIRDLLTQLRASINELGLETNKPAELRAIGSKK